nr:hypothetical protein Iba_chr10eCG12390 [Ipomoea batatas]
MVSAFFTYYHPSFLRFVLVPRSHQQINCKIDGTKNGQEPVEEVEFVLVQIIALKPPSVGGPHFPGDGIDDVNKHAAQEIPKGEGDPNAVLEAEPQDVDGVQRVPQGVAFPLDLHQGGDGHGHDGEDEADAHALELGDAGGVVGEGAGEWDEDAVVERDEEERTAAGSLKAVERLSGGEDSETDDNTNDGDEKANPPPALLGGEPDNEGDAYSGAGGGAEQERSSSSPTDLRRAAGKLGNGGRVATGGVGRRRGAETARTAGGNGQGGADADCDWSGELTSRRKGQRPMPEQLR